MIVYEVFLFFLFSNVLLGKLDGASIKVEADPFHNRSEQFKPLGENSCKYLDVCLPHERIPQIFCWQSFEYAYCAYNITKNKDCHPGLVRIAEHLLDVLERNGEFKRCGYSPDPNSVIGFSFDKSRLDLVPCYDFYIYQEEPTFQLFWHGTKVCYVFDGCWDNQNPTCDESIRQLYCCVMAMQESKCRIYYGRQALEQWRIFKKQGVMDRCELGYSPSADYISYYFENKYDKYDIKCYNLSSVEGFEFSTNRNQPTVIKGNIWFVLLAIWIIPVLLSM